MKILLDTLLSLGSSNNLDIKKKHNPKKRIHRRKECIKQENKRRAIMMEGRIMQKIMEESDIILPSHYYFLANTGRKECIRQENKRRVIIMEGRIMQKIMQESDFTLPSHYYFLAHTGSRDESCGYQCKSGCC